MSESHQFIMFKNSQGQFESGAGDTEPVDVVVNGSGFGTGPTVVLYADFRSGVVGATAQLTDAQIGAFTGAHYGTGLLPKYGEAFGRVGIQSREGGTNAATDNRLTGMYYADAPVKNFCVAFDSCVPPGRHFPGASAPGIVSALSTWKQVWMTDQAIDVRSLADVVLGTWTAGSFNFNGNDSGWNVYMSDTYDFNGWTDFLGYAIAGDDPYLDDGEIYALMSNAEIGGASIDEVTNSPVFRYSERFVITAEESTLYRITIGGVNCDYTSGVGQSASTIAQEFRDAINAAGVPNITASAAGSAVNVDATLGTIFSSTFTGPMTKQTHAPQYTHVNLAAWQGNGDQNMSQSLHSYLLVAVGDDESVKARVELLSDSNYAASALHRAVPTTVWTDTQVVVPEWAIIPGATHVCVTNSAGVQTIQALGG